MSWALIGTSLGLLGLGLSGLAIYRNRRALDRKYAKPEPGTHAMAREEDSD